MNGGGSALIGIVMVSSHIIYHPVSPCETDGQVLSVGK